jgi:hypothetical protein
MKTLIVIAVLTLPSFAQDSPLVAAAKRTKQATAKKPAVVITNATLKQSGAGAHITTTRKQAALPKMRAAAPVGSQKAAAEPQKADPQRTAPPHDDAAVFEDDPGRGDLVQCATCLPILEPVSATLPLRKAELSKNPPRIAPPVPLPIVPPRTAEAPPPH